MTSTLSLLSPGEAQRLTQRIKLTASTVRDNLFKLRNYVEEAKRSNVWQVLGFQSWSAYLADTLADEPMRLGREERQELVGYLSGEGLSTRAIAPIVGAGFKTVARDIQSSSGVSSDTPAHEPNGIPVSDADAQVPDGDEEPQADPVTGEVIEPTVTEHTVTEKTKTVTGLDGKTYTLADPKPRGRPLSDRFRGALRDLERALAQIERIQEEDQFPANQEGLEESFGQGLFALQSRLTDVGRRLAGRVFVDGEWSKRRGR